MPKYTGVYPKGNRWYYVIRNKWSRSFPTPEKAKEARAKTVEKQEEREREYPKETFAHFIVNKYYKLHVINLKPGSIKVCKNIIGKYMLPHLGRKKLSKITVTELLEFVQMLKKQNLSADRINQIIRYLRAIFNRAIEWDILEKSPARRVSMLKYEKPERPYLTAQQLVIFNNAPIFAKMPILISALTGARISEVFGLKWSDIDLEAKTISFKRRSRYVDIKKHGAIGSLKTAASVRTVPLVPGLISMLREWWDFSTSAEKMRTISRLYKATPDNEWVFPGIKEGNDNPFHYMAWEKKYWHPLKKELELPDNFHFHDLRHSFTTILIAQNIHAKVAQKLLGHQKFETTMNVYSHVTDEDLRKAVDTLQIPDLSSARMPDLQDVTPPKPDENQFELDF